MLNNFSAAPEPKVQHLPTIFRQIASGDIRIPPFQRGFVWQQKQVIELLESMYNGFPVGSILLWNVSESVFRSEVVRGSSFPAVDQKFPCSYVLDGMQRLSSLYGVFFYDKTQHTSNFDISFDFQTERFCPSDDKSISEKNIRLSALFNPRQLIDARSILMRQDDSDALLDKSVRLFSVFQEYLLPTVTISDRDLSSVVKIFERINSTGTRLGTVDFMRASTWSQSFDLTAEIGAIKDWLDEIGQSLSQDTIVKFIAIALGVTPTPENLINLRDFSDDQLHSGVASARKSIENMVSFISSEIGILSFDYVAYEAQLLAISTVFVRCGDIDGDQRDILRRWFWSTGVHEGFRGRPDDFVARSVNELTDAISRRDHRPIFKKTAEAQDFAKRPFQRKAALSSAVAAMFAAKQARSFATGDVIPVEAYMREFSNAKYHCIISPPQMKEVIGGDYYTSRIISNIAVDPDISVFGKGGLLSAIESSFIRFDGMAGSILDSQFICEKCFNSLLSKDYSAFIMQRAENMLSFSDGLCGFIPINT